MEVGIVGPSQFLPTPPRGRRHAPADVVREDPGSFYPRLREGGDKPTTRTRSWTTSVSTHASAREATPYPRIRCPGIDVSTHASAREATRVRLSSPTVIFSFYPRLREGGDPLILTARSRYGCFYPRLREGGDWPCWVPPRPWQRFLPTPPRGRRPIR